jgi:hypothetical protein
MLALYVATCHSCVIAVTMALKAAGVSGIIGCPTSSEGRLASCITQFRVSVIIFCRTLFMS